MRCQGVGLPTNSKFSALFPLTIGLTFFVKLTFFFVSVRVTPSLTLSKGVTFCKKLRLLHFLPTPEQRPSFLTDSRCALLHFLLLEVSRETRQPINH
ncbi:hypothetical protein L5515_007551 [Caenorhabditis briggsae]|uniref:Uncharacterized protein n=1 Tax=Caenorhabditis briggsae TaxID=6238 RepID=A0AAE9F7G3_CAEBR|nr:hypothetical protein L5515_007551 [Caenorhabditis briggsae]